MSVTQTLIIIKLKKLRFVKKLTNESFDFIPEINSLQNSTWGLILNQIKILNITVCRTDLSNIQGFGTTEQHVPTSHVNCDTSPVTKSPDFTLNFMLKLRCGVYFRSYGNF